MSVSNKQITERIQALRADKARTVIAERWDKTGITSDDQHVQFVDSLWSWVNVDTGAKVNISQVYWTEFED